MEITIKDLAEILCSKQSPAQSTCCGSSSKIVGQHIVVLDRGFVYVGDVTIDGDFLRMTNAKNIRYWGTKNGLGELRKGPLPETKLDVIGDVIAPMRALIHLVPVSGF